MPTIFPNFLALRYRALPSRGGRRYLQRYNYRTVVFLTARDRWDGPPGGSSAPCGRAPGARLFTHCCGLEFGRLFACCFLGVVVFLVGVWLSLVLWLLAAVLGLLG